LAVPTLSFAYLALSLGAINIHRAHIVAQNAETEFVATQVANHGGSITRSWWLNGPAILRSSLLGNGAKRWFHMSRRVRMLTGNFDSRKDAMFGVPDIYLWSVGSALFALIGLLIAQKIVHPIDIEKNQASLDATLNIVGTLVSILLGLLVAASLNNYQTLESDVDAEATSVSSVCRLSLGLPAQLQHDLMKLCLDYCDQIVHDDWPAMEHGKGDPRVFDSYVQILKKVVTFNPTTQGESNIQSAMLTAVQTMGDYRRQRILWLNNKWNRNLMPVVIMCSIIVLVFAYLYVRRGSLLLHGFLVCFVATALGANLGLIYLLSNPFRGDWKIQPEGFVVNARVIRHYTDLR
jgi:hypothetical protein